MSRRRLASLAVACSLLVACGGGSTPTSAPPSPHALTPGKGDLVLAPADYASPGGFVPRLRLSLAGEWHSTHRGADAFDLSRPAPDRDAPDVAIVFVALPSPAAQVAAAQQRFHGATRVRRQVGGRPASGFVVTGGTGRLVASPAGTLSLDAAPGQRSELVSVDGVDLAVLVVTTDAARWPALQAEVAALLAAVRVVQP